MKGRGYTIVALILAIFGLLVCFNLWGEGILRFNSGNASNRKAMVEVRNQILIGDSFESVLIKYWKSGKDSELQLEPHSDVCWMVRMPSEITTTDWRMYIGFDQEHVNSIKIRTSDGPKDPESPADVGELHACGF